MSGMITTGDNSVSTYGSRTIAIEVTGVCRQDVMRTSNYTVKVPYSRMSQTIQNINRMGGKVAGISLGSAVATETTTSAAPTEEAAPQPQPEKPKGRGRKNRNRK
ncbi:MAG: phycobilisome linker polypeptide [Cyanobacteria bacterium J06631_2]